MKNVRRKSPAAVVQAPPQPTANPSPIVEGTLTACRACGSTNRTKYTNHREIEHSLLVEDRPYTHVVWRDTSCADCGQRRTDRHLENRKPSVVSVNGSPNVPESDATDPSP